MSDAAPASTADTAASQATIQVQGRSLRKAEVLQAEAMQIETMARNGFFLLTAMCFPIIAMVIFTILEGPAMWGIGLVTAAGPFIAIAVGLAWKKPWGVVIETPARYRTVYQASSREDAERVANDIRAAIA